MIIKELQIKQIIAKNTVEINCIIKIISGKV